MSASTYTYTTLSNFNSLIIIESLADGERKTGFELSEKMKLYCSSQNLNLDVFYFDVKNKQQLTMVMAGIEYATKNDFCIKPIIHFEIHGYDDKSGLALAEHNLGDAVGSVNWDEFCDMTRPINLALKNNLLVSMSVCHGFYAITDMHLSKTAPFWGILGSDKVMYECELAEMFPEIFEKILAGATVNNAINEVNARYSRTQIRFTSADKMLFTSSKMYFEKLCKDESAFNRRVSILVDQARQSTPEPYPGFYEEFASAYLRNKERNRLSFIDKACKFLCRNDDEFIKWVSEQFDAIYSENGKRSFSRSTQKQ